MCLSIGPVKVYKYYNLNSLTGSLGASVTAPIQYGNYQLRVGQEIVSNRKWKNKTKYELERKSVSKGFHIVFTEASAEYEAKRSRNKTVVVEFLAKPEDLISLGMWSGHSGAVFKTLTVNRIGNTFQHGKRKNF